MEYDHLSTMDDDWLCPRCPLSELPFYEDSIHHNSSNNESLETSESLTTSHDILNFEPTDSNSLLNIPSSNSSITIAHLNIQSLIPKIDILRDSLAVSSSSIKPVTILTLSETWLNNDINDCQITIQGYDLFRTDRVTHGGGVAAYVLYHLKVHRRPDLEINEADILWLELRLRSRRILIGVTYRPPNDINFFTRLILLPRELVWKPTNHLF